MLHIAICGEPVRGSLSRSKTLDVEEGNLFSFSRPDPVVVPGHLLALFPGFNEPPVAQVRSCFNNVTLPTWSCSPDPSPDVPPP